MDIGETMSEQDKFLDIVFNETYNDSKKNIIFDIERQVGEELIDIGAEYTNNQLRFLAMVFYNSYTKAYDRGMASEDIILYPGAGAL